MDKYCQNLSSCNHLTTFIQGSASWYILIFGSVNISGFIPIPLVNFKGFSVQSFRFNRFAL